MNTEISEQGVAKSPTFEIHDLELTSEAYRSIGQRTFKLKATILVKEPEFRNRSYLLVLYEKIGGTYAYVTVEKGRGTLEIYNLLSSSGLPKRSGTAQDHLSLVGHLELKTGTLLISTGNSK